MSAYFSDYQQAAKEILAQVGNQIVIGIPIALGKPVGLVNALYQLALDNTEIKLTIITGLTFARPILKNTLEKQFLQPILDRIEGDYIEPRYEYDRIHGHMPANITVIEFFLSPGKFLHNTYAQQNYISSSYTNVVRDAANLSLNVLAQAIAPHPTEQGIFSLSCNSDLFHDMRAHLLHAREHGKKVAIVGEVNANLPYMYGNMAEVKDDIFTTIVDHKSYRSLFAVAREALSIQDHLIGLYASTLIKDNGCLQIGIGTLSNALAYALIKRHQDNATYQAILNDLSIQDKAGNLINDIGSLTPFDIGLYSSTEMLSDEFLQMYVAGILKKKAYDHIGLQKLANTQQIPAKIDATFIQTLIDHHIIATQIDENNLRFLQHFGIFKDDIKLTADKLMLATGETISANLATLTNNDISLLLGTAIKHGKLMHAGFFFGSKDFYHRLKTMSFAELQLIDMTSIARTNSLLQNRELYTLQRLHARFVNSSLMVTLLGSIISDGIKNYQEISGVGGQYDFVNMSEELATARSIIFCRSTRESKEGLQSNIVWEYPNLTIPRYLRDIVITEYGIADCRSKTDSDVIKAMLNVADSRFQPALLKQAKLAGKINQDYQIPAPYRNNTPQALRKLAQHPTLAAYLKPYPFGSDFTPEEEVLAQALTFLKQLSPWKLARFAVKALFSFSKDKPVAIYLQRMNLLHPKTIKEYLYKKTLKAAIKEVT